ncbi:hypothetical protein MKY84_00855 [Chryseomicrobium sp. FSL W7-1435]|uniref:hypothetical protein n=1 Tax=Chryseomicrobium sp. FSL W7-1435 TaxID=2921704 RepID=UPI003159D592
MKNSGVCPKCNHDEVLHLHGILELNQIGNNIYTGAAGTITASPVGRYLCMHCGYLEEWLDNMHDIEKIKKRYTPFKWGD